MRIFMLQFRKKNFKWFIAINIYFSFTEKVEIWPIDDCYLHLTNVIKFKNTDEVNEKVNRDPHPVFSTGVIVFGLTSAKI